MSIDDRIVELLLRLEARRAGGEPVTPDQLCAGDHELAEKLKAHIRFLAEFDPEYAALLKAPAAAESRDDEPYEAWVGEELAARYRPEQLHARGGVGEVHKFRDADFGRTVALKRMQRRHIHDPASRHRFLREAAITARLEHPGIVPVYGLIRDRRGQSCYVMRFVEGETLQDAIARLHAPPKLPTDEGERAQLFLRLLGRFIAVCNTVAYAHSRGVIHRDLKPANVMLGKYGETLVVDWGLAKFFQASEAATACAGDTGMESLDAEVSQAGRAMGTVEYMAPEQAAGRHGEVGPASDVYSLGATLYVLLTGKPAFDRKRVDVFDAIERGQFPPPRHVKRDAPKALEAVCLKAMSLAPTDRYADAGALAADVERWLSGEPVSAYREPWAARAARLARRHRTGVVAAVTAVGIAAVCLAVASVLLLNANRKIEQEHDRAETAVLVGLKTLAAVDQSHTAVNRVLPLPIEHRQGGRDSADVKALRRALLAGAVRQYDNILGEFGDRPGTEYELAVAYVRLADIQAVTEAPAEERAASVRRAADFCERLLTRDADSRDYRRLRALVYALEGKTPEARQVWQQLLAEDPADAAAATPLATDLFADGLGRWERGDVDGALRVLPEATAVWEAAMARGGPLEWDARRKHAYTLSLLAKVQAQAGKSDAKATRLRALTLFTKLHEERPDDIYVTDRLAESLLMADTDDPNALQQLRESCRLREELLMRFRQRNPNAYHYVADLLRSYTNRAIQELAEERRADALETYRKFWEEAKGLRVPESDREVRQLVARACFDLTAVMSSRDQSFKKFVLYEEARERFESLANSDKAPGAFRYELSLVQDYFGMDLARRGLSREAAAAHEAALEYFALALKHAAAASREGIAFDQTRCTIHRHQLAGELADAAKLAQALRDGGKNDSEQLRFIAQEFARCASAVGKGKPALTAEERARRDGYAAEAVRTLQGARKDGKPDLDLTELKDNPDFDVLRERDDFRCLLTEAEAAR